MDRQKRTEDLEIVKVVLVMVGLQLSNDSYPLLLTTAARMRPLSMVPGRRALKGGSEGRGGQRAKKKLQNMINLPN